MTRTKNVISFQPDWFSRRGKRRDGATPPARALGARRRPLLLGATTLASLAAACGYGGTAQAAPKEKVLFSFTNIRGSQSDAGLIADGAGNLYGTTIFGGATDHGAVFELSPPAAGETAWTEKVLFSFNKIDGARPQAGLIADGAGNLYGTTQDGGTTYEGGTKGQGVVFELSPPAAGRTAWTETVLLSFNKTNGDQPLAGLLADGAGNLYGTTYAGGAHSGGVVFELSPPAAGGTAWTDAVLFSFDRASGEEPSAGLIADGAGNLYGTALQGGPHHHGVVFELSPPAAGGTAWTEKVLLSFGGANSLSPATGLIADGAGNLYGTVPGPGPVSTGRVFELSPPAAGGTAWTETVLHTFNGPDGSEPLAGLLADGAGNFYGTTWQGGAFHSGVVFKLTPPAAGKRAWAEKVLLSFNGTNGSQPFAGLIADGAGNLYGTTQDGGAYGKGVVFRLKP